MSFIYSIQLKNLTVQLTIKTTEVALKPVVTERINLTRKGSNLPGGNGGYCEVIGDRGCCFPKITYMFLL